ncbi:hypothetical protein M2387_003607 [Klebsiella sp. BIGb0407]|nr:hypothetical protein [Klebsiella sp. BIGb0407]
MCFSLLQGINHSFTVAIGRQATKSLMIDCFLISLFNLPPQDC